MGTMRDVAVDKNLHFTHIRQPKLNCFPDSKWYESILLLHVIAACVITIGWCYFPSVGTEIKCNNSLFSTDGK